MGGKIAALAKSRQKFKKTGVRPAINQKFATDHQTTPYAKTAARMPPIIIPNTMPRRISFFEEAIIIEELAQRYDRTNRLSRSGGHRPPLQKTVCTRCLAAEGLDSSLSVGQHRRMGVHFTVTVDHNIHDNSLAYVRSRLAPLQQAFQKFSIQSQSESDDWRDVTFPGHSSKHFDTPGGFSLLIGPTALHFHHGTRFSTFIESATERSLLRQFSQQLAHILGQGRVLYAPCEGIGDEIFDWVIEGLSLADMEAQLRKRSCPPATIPELARRSLPELRYFVDEVKQKIETSDEHA